MEMKRKYREENKNDNEIKRTLRILIQFERVVWEREKDLVCVWVSVWALRYCTNGHLSFMLLSSDEPTICSANERVCASVWVFWMFLNAKHTAHRSQVIWSWCWLLWDCVCVCLYVALFALALPQILAYKFGSTLTHWPQFFRYCDVITSAFSSTAQPSKAQFSIYMQLCNTTTAIGMLCVRFSISDSFSMCV